MLVIVPVSLEGESVITNPHISYCLFLLLLERITCLALFEESHRFSLSLNILSYAWLFLRVLFNSLILFSLPCNPPFPFCSCCLFGLVWFLCCGGFVLLFTLLFCRGVFCFVLFVLLSPPKTVSWNRRIIRVTRIQRCVTVGNLSQVPTGQIRRIPTSHASQGHK